MGLYRKSVVHTGFDLYVYICMGEETSVYKNM